MPICMALLSLWNPFPNKVAFHGAFICDGFFFSLHLYCNKTFLISSSNVFILLLWILILRGEGCSPCYASHWAQTGGLYLLWKWLFRVLGHRCWMTDFSLCFAFLWPQVSNGHKSDDGIWYLGWCHLCGLLSWYLYSFYSFPPAKRRGGGRRIQRRLWSRIPRGQVLFSIPISELTWRPLGEFGEL